MTNPIRHKAVYTVIILYASVLLASCGHHLPPAKAERKINPAISATLMQLQGSWICDGYKQNLTKTRSPFHSSAYIDGVFSFVIDSNNVSGDTVYFTGLIKGLEDKSLWISLSRRDSAGRYYAGQKKSTDADASPNDNIIRARIDSGYLTLYTAGSDSCRYAYYDHAYRGRSADYILKQYTTTTLFGGQYVTRDSPLVFGSSHIAFDPLHPGRLTGSPVYDSFDINIDVLAQQDTSDYIELYDTRGVSESHSYTYKIKGNNLKIFQLNDGLACSLLQYLDTAIHQDSIIH